MKLPKINVDWSYPTSPNATRAGCSKVGCWSVSVVWFTKTGVQKPPEFVRGFATHKEAIAFAHQLSKLEVVGNLNP